jgi:SPP1 gp7 family putative phage head morphogenesis protein
MPRAENPTTIQVDYFRAIEPIVDRASALVRREVYPLVQRALAERRDDARLDATNLNASIDRVARQFADMLRPTQLEEVARRFGSATSTFQREQLNKQIRAAMGVDLSTIEPNVLRMIDDFTADNVALIKSVPQRFFADIETRITSGVRAGQRWEDMAAELEARHGVAKERAKVIARDQVGKFYGELNQKRQENLGITGYIWRTSNDNRVRDEHELREGVHFEWNAPPADGHPGEPVLCRCYGEPDVESILKELRNS